MPNEQTYTFTETQLRNLLQATLGIQREFEYVHGSTNPDYDAIKEMLDGLDSERWLVEMGEIKTAGLQVLP